MMFSVGIVGFSPININGWLFAVGLYSLLAWLLSLIISLSIQRDKEFIPGNFTELTIKTNPL
ncbi:MAG: hypothetical protein JW715_10425 [Sedimentisphaerales bacterium]|nr:hypothetical protein [Sedimentisphaerales bacterium]